MEAVDDVDAVPEARNAARAQRIERVATRGEAIIIGKFASALILPLEAPALLLRRSPMKARAKLLDVISRPAERFSPSAFRRALMSEERADNFKGGVAIPLVETRKQGALIASQRSSEALRERVVSKWHDPC